MMRPNIPTRNKVKNFGIFWRTLATGMDPAEVGPMVLDAIVNEKFWILTHPEMGEIAVNQSRAMLEDQRLTR